jgi:O-antigen ligase
MAESMQTAYVRPHNKHGNRMNIYAALAIPVLLSALLLMLLVKTSALVVCCGVLIFFMGSIFLIMGNILMRFIYIFFLIQFTAALFIPVSLYVTIISLLFFPLALKRDSISNELTAPPFAKHLLLLLSGWVVSLTYISINNNGEFKYFFMYDIFFLLGLVSAYEMFIAFRLKFLEPDKLIPCIALSGFVIVCVVFAKYFVLGISLSTIFIKRLGMAVDINPNVITAYLDLALPCALFTAFFEKRSLRKKILFYSLSAFIVCAILLAATRGSLPGIAILAAYVIWRKRSKRLLLFVLICSVSVAFTIGAPIVERMVKPNTADILSNMGRVELLRAALKVLKDNHYFFGIGMNNFSQMKFSYGFPQWFDTKRVMSSHNFFVEIWMGWGLLGLLGWLSLNASIVLSILRKHKDNCAANAAAFAIIAFSVHGLMDSFCANYSIMLAYFSLMGIAFFYMKEGRVKNPSFNADTVTS